VHRAENGMSLRWTNPPGDARVT